MPPCYIYFASILSLFCRYWIMADCCMFNMYLKCVFLNNYFYDLLQNLFFPYTLLIKHKWETHPQKLVGKSLLLSPTISPPWKLLHTFPLYWCPVYLHKYTEQFIFSCHPFIFTITLWGRLLWELTGSNSLWEWGFELGIPISYSETLTTTLLVTFMGWQL